MKIHVFCPNREHAVNHWIETWAGRNSAEIIRSKEGLTGGDFLFLISCPVIVDSATRDKYRHVLVLHASDLPKGRGWSPYFWTVIEGGNEIVLSMIKAEDRVDSGDIWQQERIPLKGTETYDEINGLIFEAELRLMDWAIRNCDLNTPSPQSGAASYHPRPPLSEVSPDQTLAEIFDLLRVSDPGRFPAYFEHRGERYTLTLSKATAQIAQAA